MNPLYDGTNEKLTHGRHRAAANIVRTVSHSNTIVCLRSILLLLPHRPHSSVSLLPPLPSPFLLHRLQQNPQVLDSHERVRVLAPKSPLQSLERAAKEGLGEVKLSLIFQQHAHVAD